jgi:hypothetical protein
MPDSLISAFVDFLLHVLCYRVGEVVLRALSLGYLGKEFFDRYTYFTILVGACSMVSLAIMVWFVIR